MGANNSRGGFPILCIHRSLESQLFFLHFQRFSRRISGKNAKGTPRILEQMGKIFLQKNTHVPTWLSPETRQASQGLQGLTRQPLRPVLDVPLGADRGGGGSSKPEANVKRIPFWSANKEPIKRVPLENRLGTPQVLHLDGKVK